jgi:hypothetical protein
MPLRRWTLILLCIATGCGRSDKAVAHGVKVSGTSSDSTTTIAVTGEWPAELGAALVIPSDTENLAVVLYPATQTPQLDAQSQLTLLAPSGDTLRVRVGVSSPDSAHCGDAPIVHLTHATPLLWSIGLSGAKARQLRSDSLEGLSPGDSLLYSTEAPRRASAVSATVSTRLTGLPFSLTALRRLRFADTTIIAALLSRRVNQEANPVEERTFVIAESAGSSPFSTVHSDRSDGTEESAAHFDLLGAFKTPSALYLVITTDTPAGSTIEILERSGGAWRVRWTRTIAC